LGEFGPESPADANSGAAFESAILLWLPLLLTLLLLAIVGVGFVFNAVTLGEIVAELRLPLPTGVRTPTGLSIIVAAVMVAPGEWGFERLPTELKRDGGFFCFFFLESLAEAAAEAEESAAAPEL
jgi:hypothetical protein